MVSAIWATIAASLGLLVYLLVPVLANFYPVEIRESIGRTYLKLGARCLKQFTFVRRVLSGYDVLPITVDDEKKLLKVTLKSSTLGDDDEYQFKDPDNRIQRLFGKPVALAYEEVPAAIDAELAELGHWVREKQMNSGLWSGDLDDKESVEIDPYVPMSDKLRLVDPIDVFELVSNDVDPENIKTAEKLTEMRYKEYGSDIGMAETVSTIMGFIVGVAGVAGVQYLRNQIMDGGGSGSGVDVPVNPMVDTAGMQAVEVADVALQVGVSAL